jgi:hypothetical protein
MIQAFSRYEFKNMEYVPNNDNNTNNKTEKSIIYKQ